MLVLNVPVDETSSLPQVASPAEVRDHPGSCFCEVLPHSDLPPEVLFPDSTLVASGETTAPAWWSDDASNIAAFHVFKIVKAFFLPAAGLVITQAGDVMRLPFEDAAYFSPDLTLVPGIDAEQGVTALRLPEKVPGLSRIAVSMSQGAMVNYGHFVLDCLPALASLTDEPAFCAFKPVVPPLKPWQRRHFELLGVDPLELSGNIYFADEVLYTTAMHHYLHTPNLNYDPVRTRQLAGRGGRTGPDTVQIISVP